MVGLPPGNPLGPASVLPDDLAEMDRSRNPHVPVMIRVIIGLGLREYQVTILPGL